MAARYLIVGASGFVGRHLAAHLAALQAEVYTLQFENRPNRSNLPGIRVLTAVEPRHEAIARVLPREAFDAVFHIAAAGVNPSDRDPGELLQGNVLLVDAVLRAVASNPPASFVYTGTCAEYSRALGVCVTEEHPVLNADLYGASKAMGTIWAMAMAAQLNINLAALRVFHIYGPGESPHRLVSSLIRQLAAGQPVDLSPGDQVRDLLYIPDLLDAFLAATRVPAGLYNVCSSLPVTVREVAAEVARQLNIPDSLLRFGALPYRPGELMWLVGGNTRFREASGWTPNWSLAEGLRDMLTIHSTAS